MLAVEATVPLVPIRHAGARILRNPARKGFFFLLSDGPMSTYRKARTKTREPRFSGDYHVVLTLGRDARCERRLVALACRAPRCADFLIVHEQLAIEVGVDFDDEALCRAASALQVEAIQLEQLGRERYLYSNTTPPLELVVMLRRAIETHVCVPALAECS